MKDRYEGSLSFRFERDNSNNRYLAVTVPEGNSGDFTSPWGVYAALSGSGRKEPDLANPTNVSMLEKTLWSELFNMTSLQFIRDDSAASFLNRDAEMPAKEKQGREFVWQEIKEHLASGKFMVTYMLGNAPGFVLPGAFYR